jgi:hypothetical protein
MIVTVEAAPLNQRRERTVVVVRQRQTHSRCRGVPFRCHGSFSLNAPVSSVPPPCRTSPAASDNPRWRWNSGHCWSNPVGWIPSSVQHKWRGCFCPLQYLCCPSLPFNTDTDEHMRTWRLFRTLISSNGSRRAPRNAAGLQVDLGNCVRSVDPFRVQYWKANKKNDCRTPTAMPRTPTPILYPRGGCWPKRSSSSANTVVGPSDISDTLDLACFLTRKIHRIQRETPRLPPIEVHSCDPAAGAPQAVPQIGRDR